MIHGILFRQMKADLKPTLRDGSHPVLNLDPTRQRILTWSNDNVWLAQSVDKPCAMQQVARHAPSGTSIVAWVAPSLTDLTRERFSTSRSTRRPRTTE